MNPRTVPRWTVTGKMAKVADRWFFCLLHNEVEQEAGCRAGDRLGPYPDRETAARALQIANERTEQADRDDRDWERD